MNAITSSLLGDEISQECPQLVAKTEMEKCSYLGQNWDLENIWDVKVIIIDVICWKMHLEVSFFKKLEPQEWLRLQFDEPLRLLLD